MKTHTCGLEDYFAYKLNMFKQEKPIPPYVMETIMKSLKDKNITSPSSNDIKTILKETYLMKYYEYTHQILIKLNNPVISEVDECVICYEQFDKFAKLICGHKFCNGCTNKISKDNLIVCPLCRNQQSFEKHSDIIHLDKRKMIDYFKENKEKYRRGKNFLPFDLIIQDVMENTNMGINLDESSK